MEARKLAQIIDRAVKIILPHRQVEYLYSQHLAISVDGMIWAKIVPINNDWEMLEVCIWFAAEERWKTSIGYESLESAAFDTVMRIVSGILQAEMPELCP